MSKQEENKIDIPRIDRPAYKWDAEVKRLAERVGKIITENEIKDGRNQKQIPAPGY